MNMMFSPNNVINIIHRMPDNLKGVTILGAGRIGGNLAVRLNECGVKKMILIDKDKVSKNNIESHELSPFDRSDMRRYKVNAICKKLNERSEAFGRTGYSITVYKTYISDDISYRTLEKMLGDSLIVVWAIDSVKGLMMLEGEELLRLNSRIHVLTAMHARVGGGHVVVWLGPYFSPCMKHSLGLNSFSQIIEGPAHEANISDNDIRVVTDCTANVVCSLLFRRYGGFSNRLDLERGNYMHIEKLSEGRYRKFWIKSHSVAGCPLCGI